MVGTINIHLIPDIDPYLFPKSSIVLLGPYRALKYRSNFLRVGPSLDRNGLCGFFASRASPIDTQKDKSITQRHHPPLKIDAIVYVKQNQSMRYKISKRKYVLDVAVLQYGVHVDDDRD
ncbi:hypothetical protein YC2023_024983 [Brassica napus]